MGTGWSLAFFAAAAVLAASLATAALAGELCRLPVRRIAAVSTIAALLLICGEVLALLARPPGAHFRHSCKPVYGIV